MVQFRIFRANRLAFPQSEFIVGCGTKKLLFRNLLETSGEKRFFAVIAGPDFRPQNHKLPATEAAGLRTSNTAGKTAEMKSQTTGH